MRFSLFGLLFLFAGLVRAAEALPPARDFVADARASGDVPILVFFTSESCPYCRAVESLYLQPMQARGTYRGRLLIRTVEVGGAAPLTDFAGGRTTHGEFARRERVSFTPVIRLYGADGRELAPQLLGYTTPDFYLGYLEQAIEQAIARARPARTAVLR
jgi:thioredoxin-related protein